MRKVSQFDTFRKKLLSNKKNIIMYIDFKITTWERIHIKDESLKENVDVLMYQDLVDYKQFLNS